MRSIITDNYEECYLCHRYIGDGTGEEHHIFGGANRKNSEKYGLKVPLCHACHNEPPMGVHFNAVMRNALKATAQEIFEEEYGYEEFMKIFGRNYL